MPKDYYIQPDAPDPVLDEQAVLSLARRYLPEARSMTRIEMGGEARAYSVDQGFVLKTQLPHRLRPRTALEKEAFFLRRLEGVNGVTVPRVLGYGRNDGVEYILMTRMPGKPISTTSLAGESRRRALFELGRMLRVIHELPQKPFIESRLFPGDQSPVDVRWRFGNAFDDAVESIGRSGRPWPYGVDPLTVARRAMRSLPDVGTWVAQHSNPGPEHVFADPESGGLTGIIDFGDAYFGHPVNDLRRFPHPLDRRAVFEGYTATAPASDDFLLAWRVACVLTDIGVMTRSSELAAAAAAELDSVLAGM